MRCVLIVGDGMADLPLPELGFKTPLEVAKVKFMNELACKGVLGLLDPIAPGIAPGSDAANLAFLGYDSELVCKGRGPFEAAGAGLPGEKKYSYRLAGNTCLAGDIIGDYSFDEKLKSGDKIVFLDMAHYTMVKNNTFNRVKLPSIVLYSADGKIKTVKKFGYDDFKARLS
jgi:2,3-bisphosphoglycerate-independent phosphoglycerate mutase